MPSLTQSPLRQIASPRCACFPSCEMGILVVTTSQEQWEHYICSKRCCKSFTDTVPFCSSEKVVVCFVLVFFIGPEVAVL